MMAQGGWGTAGKKAWQDLLTYSRQQQGLVPLRLQGDARVDKFGI